MKKVKKQGLLCLVIIIGLQLFKIGMLRSMPQVYTQGRIMIYPNEPLEVESFTQRESYSTLSPVVLNEKKVCFKQRQERMVIGRGTTKEFPLLEPITMIEGAFWGERADRDGRQVVVISDHLAKQYFGSIAVVGQICEIEDVYYQVIGVYEKGKNFWERWFDIDEEIIYYPISSLVGKTRSEERRVGKECTSWCKSRW